MDADDGSDAIQHWSNFAEQAQSRLHDASTNPDDLPKHGDWVLNPDFAPKHDDPPLTDAAVLVPVIKYEAAPAILLTQRTRQLSSHAGQVAFPGGKIDPTDLNPVDAALREAEEEIGLRSNLVEVLGLLPQYLTRTRYRIIPVVGLVATDARLFANLNEVDEIFEVPLAFLMDSENHKFTTAVFEGRERYYYEMPYGFHRIWGVTAGIIRCLYEQLGHDQDEIL